MTDKPKATAAGAAALLAAFLLATTAAQAESIWAIPDSGGGFLLQSPGGMGTAIPDGGGGFLINPPPAAPSIRPRPYQPLSEPSPLSLSPPAAGGYALGGPDIEPDRSFRCASSEMGSGVNITLSPGRRMAWATYDFNPALAPDVFRLATSPAVYVMELTRRQRLVRMMVDRVNLRLTFPLSESEGKGPPTICRMVFPN